MPSHLIVLRKGVTGTSASKLYKELSTALKQQAQTFTIHTIGPEFRMWRLNVSNNMRKTVKAVLSRFKNGVVAYEVRCKIERKKQLREDHVHKFTTSDDEKVIKAEDDDLSCAISQSSLLSLPAEIRNRIYQYVLIEKEELDMTPEDDPPTEPGLLHTCRQIRLEAIGIYYSENKFMFDIDNYDATKFIQWCEHSNQRRDANKVFFVESCRNWDRLLQWVEAYSTHRASGFNWVESDEAEKKIAAEMFSLTDLLHEFQILDQNQIVDVLEQVVHMLKFAQDGWS